MPSSDGPEFFCEMKLPDSNFPVPIHLFSCFQDRDTEL